MNHCCCLLFIFYFFFFSDVISLSLPLWRNPIGSCSLWSVLGGGGRESPVKHGARGASTGGEGNDGCIMHQVHTSLEWRWFVDTLLLIFIRLCPPSFVMFSVFFFGAKTHIVAKNLNFSFMLHIYYFWGIFFCQISKLKNSEFFLVTFGFKLLFDNISPDIFSRTMSWPKTYLNSCFMIWLNLPRDDSRFSSSQFCPLLVEVTIIPRKI